MRYRRRGFRLPSIWSWTLFPSLEKGLRGTSRRADTPQGSGRGILSFRPAAKLGFQATVFRFRRPIRGHSPAVLCLGRCILPIEIGCVKARIPETANARWSLRAVELPSRKELPDLPAEGRPFRNMRCRRGPEPRLLAVLARGCGCVAPNGIPPRRLQRRRFSGENRPIH